MKFGVRETWFKSSFVDYQNDHGKVTIAGFQLSHLLNNKVYLNWVLGGLGEVKYVKYLGQFTAHN